MNGRKALRLRREAGVKGSKVEYTKEKQFQLKTVKDADGKRVPEIVKETGYAKKLQLGPRATYLKLKKLK